jgi:hypothetical protein
VEPVFTGQVDEAAIAQLEAGVDRGLRGLAVTLIVLASGGAEATAVIAALEDDVDDARDRIRTVLRGGAVLQNFDARDRRGGNEAEIGGSRTGVGDPPRTARLAVK